MDKLQSIQNTLNKKWNVSLKNAGLNYYIINILTIYIWIYTRAFHTLYYCMLCLHATNNPGLAILSDLNLSLVATFPFQRAGMKKASRKIIWFLFLFLSRKSTLQFFAISLSKFEWFMNHVTSTGIMIDMMH